MFTHLTFQIELKLCSKSSNKLLCTSVPHEIWEKITSFSIVNIPVTPAKAALKNNCCHTNSLMKKSAIVFFPVCPQLCDKFQRWIRAIKFCLQRVLLVLKLKLRIFLIPFSTLTPITIPTVITVNNLWNFGKIFIQIQTDVYSFPKRNTDSIYMTLLALFS